MFAFRKDPARWSNHILRKFPPQRCAGHRLIENYVLTEGSLRPNESCRSNSKTCCVQHTRRNVAGALVLLLPATRHFAAYRVNLYGAKRRLSYDLIGQVWLKPREL